MLWTSDLRQAYSLYQKNVNLYHLEYPLEEHRRSRSWWGVARCTLFNNLFPLSAFGLEFQPFRPHDKYKFLATPLPHAAAPIIVPVGLKICDRVNGYQTLMALCRLKKNNADDNSRPGRDGVLYHRHHLTLLHRSREDKMC